MKTRKPKPLNKFEKFIKYWGFLPFALVIFIPAIIRTYYYYMHNIDVSNIGMTIWLTSIVVIFLATMILRNKVTIRELEIQEYYKNDSNI